MIKRGFIERLVIKYFNLKYGGYWARYSRYDPEPKDIIEINFLEKPKIVFSREDSILRKVRKKQVKKALKKLEDIGKNSEDLENRI